MTELFSEEWGDGEPVVLVHGSLSTGAEEWAAQRPLAEEGYRLLPVDRRGYGRSPAAPGEDFLRDAEDVADLLGDGAHLVGHSYGGLGALLAAARRPDATRSLTVMEPAALPLGERTPAGREFVASIRAVWDRPDLGDDEWAVGFLKAAGSDPDKFPPDFLAVALPLVPLVRNARPPFTVELPLAELAAAPFPKLVASGGHHAGFDAICDELADRIGATRIECAGAGHEVQLSGDAINEAMLALWRSA